MQKLQFHGVPFINVDLSACATDALFRKSLPVQTNSRLFPTFSSIRFRVPAFMLRPLIHLYYFVQGNKYGSFCILHSVIQFDQYHLLRMLSFFSAHDFVGRGSGPGGSLCERLPYSFCSYELLFSHRFPFSPCGYRG